MFAKSFSLLALVGTAIAQSQSLNATLAGNPNLSNLTTFVTASPGLLNVLAGLRNITVLAPSNQAFAELLNSDAGRRAASDPGALAAILTYHVLNGSYPASALSNRSAFVPTLLRNSSYTNVTSGQVVDGVVVGNQVKFYSGLLQNSTVTQADVNFTGGVVHVIDKVLTLPPNVLDTASALNLTSFRGAVNATGLATTMNETPNLTIFAPNNAALASIGSALANLSTTDLSGILAYHVVNGTVGYSTGLTNGQNLTTFGGRNLTVHIDNGNVFVNGAKVVTPNVLIANGVVHVIDNVLNPSNTTGPASGAMTGAVAYASATAVGSGVPFTSGQPAPTTTVVGTSSASSRPTSSTSAGAAMPKMTGSVGYGALLGAGAAMAFL